MITIIRKEILENMQSMQFLMLLVLTLILFLANGLLFARKYERQIEWYGKRTAGVTENPSTIYTTLHTRPVLLAFIADAGDDAAPPGYELYQTGGLRPLPAGTGNTRLPEVPQADWSFIIKVIFSLYAVLMGYDAIAGEKERGTLRLILTGPTGRARLLVAKYAAMMLTLAIPLVCGMLLSLITTGIALPGAAALPALSAGIQTFILGMVYLSLWVFLCLCVSAALHDSSLALLTLLVAWIVLAIIVPNTAGIVSEKVTSIPSEFSAARELGPTIKKQVWDRINVIAKSVERGDITTEVELKRQADMAFAEGQKSLRDYFASYEKAVRGRAEIARWISRLSPTALFQFAAEDIAGTGVHREERFLREAHAYSETYDAYVLRKTGRLVAASGWGFGTFIELGGKDISIGSPRPMEYQGDKSDFPRFVESQRPAGEGLHDALLDCAGLILWNIVLAGAALGAISRSDVR